MSVAPLTSVAPAASSETTVVLSEKGLERTGKILPIFCAIMAVVVLPLGAWYGGQQGQKAYLDTLISERGARNAETRQMVVDLRKDFTDEQRASAEFRGRTDATLQAIKDAVTNERADRRDTRPR